MIAIESSAIVQGLGLMSAITAPGSREMPLVSQSQKRKGHSARNAKATQGRTI